MLNWLSANWGNLLMSAVLVAVAAAIIIRLVRNKRAGVSSCGCGCPGCTKGKCRS